MGKRIIPQRRGKGTSRYRAPSFRFRAAVKLPRTMKDEVVSGTVVDLVTCQAHSAPLAKIKMNNEFVFLLAPEGIQVGQTIQVGNNAETQVGNSLSLIDIPEGTLVYNIESQPGDGGKFVRSSGTYARILTKTPAGVVLRMPSKKQKTFNNDCRASIGVVAGGGRLEKPMLKAGVKHFKRKAKNRMYPHVSGSAMNAVDHPFGNKRTSRKSKSKPTSWNAPPGRKVGAVGARRTGRKKK